MGTAPTRKPVRHQIVTIQTHQMRDAVAQSQTRPQKTLPPFVAQSTKLGLGEIQITGRRLDDGVIRKTLHLPMDARIAGHLAKAEGARRIPSHHHQSPLGHQLTGCRGNRTLHHPSQRYHIRGGVELLNWYYETDQWGQSSEGEKRRFSHRGPSTGGVRRQAPSIHMNTRDGAVVSDCSRRKGTLAPWSNMPSSRHIIASGLRQNARSGPASRAEPASHSRSGPGTPRECGARTGDRAGASSPKP